MDYKKTMVDFKEYIDESKYTKDRKSKLNNLLRKIEVWEAATKKNIWEFDKELVLKLCEFGVSKKEYEHLLSVFEDSLFKPVCGNSYFGLCKSISCLNEIFEFFGKKDIIIDINDFENIPNKKDDLFFKEEIINICNMLTNPQDKFIIYGIFSGIKGNTYSDLVSLKVEDVDFENKVINLPSGHKIEMDEYLEDVLKDTLSEFGMMYYSISKRGASNGVKCYYFNECSPYVLKTKPTSTNNNGCNPMALQGIQTRLKSISVEAHRDLLGANVFKSGVIYKMNELKKEWTQSEVKEFIESNGYGLNAYETQRAHDNKYNRK